MVLGVSYLWLINDRFQEPTFEGIMVWKVLPSQMELLMGDPLGGTRTYEQRLDDYRLLC